VPVEGGADCFVVGSGGLGITWLGTETAQPIVESRSTHLGSGHKVLDALAGLIAAE
jgi:hypothetical protein